MISIKALRTALAAAIFAAVLCPFLGTAACAEDATDTQKAKEKEKKQHTVIMPAVSLYMPTSSKTKDVFESTWPSIGFVAGSGIKDRLLDKVEFHVEGVLRQHNDDHVYLFPAGVMYTIRPAKGAGLAPYFGATADLYFADIKSVDFGVKSGLRTTAGGSVFAGVDIGKKFTLRASYFMVPEISTFDLSGFNLTAAMEF